MVIWLKRWLPAVALAVTLLALLEPLEGFPLVLSGGVLTTMAALQRGTHLRLATWGLGLGVLGCVAMVGLSLRGGVGGATGRSLWWLFLIAPYPAGMVLVVAADVLMLRGRPGGCTAGGRS